MTNVTGRGSPLSGWRGPPRDPTPAAPGGACSENLFDAWHGAGWRPAQGRVASGAKSPQRGDTGSGGGCNRFAFRPLWPEVVEFRCDGTLAVIRGWTAQNKLAFGWALAVSGAATLWHSWPHSTFCAWNPGANHGAASSVMTRRGARSGDCGRQSGAPRNQFSAAHFTNYYCPRPAVSSRVYFFWVFRIRHVLSAERHPDRQSSVSRRTGIHFQRGEAARRA